MVEDLVGDSECLGVLGIDSEGSGTCWCLVVTRGTLGDSVTQNYCVREGGNSLGGSLFCWGGALSLGRIYYKIYIGNRLDSEKIPTK